MPFTPTHTLAILPIAKYWSPPGCFTALLVGSMVPDWPLYVPFGPPYALTHSIVGLFVACLPLGLALTAAYQGLLKRALFNLLPLGLRARVISHVDTPMARQPRAWFLIAMAVLVGAATHLAWDGFTHRGAWGVELVPALAQSWFRIGGVAVGGYAVLQHGSSLLGLPIMILLFASWYRRAPINEVPPLRISPGAQRAWRVLLVVTPAVLMSMTLVNSLMSSSITSAMYRLIDGVTRTGFVILLSLAVYAMYFAMTSRRDDSTGLVTPDEPPAER